MIGTSWRAAGTLSGRGRFGRPKGIVDSTRWLFAALALVSLVVTLPALLTFAHGATLVLGLGAALTVSTSWVAGYRLGRAPFALDGLDALALGAFALACPNPMSVMGLAFSAVWFRALYGSTLRSVIRCGCYMITIALAVVLWQLIPQHTSATAFAPVLGAFPVLLLTVFVARQLARGLQDREQSLNRDAIVAASGSRLLGMTDPSAIRAVAWSALTDICEATPGMRAVLVTRDGAVLRLDGATGGFRSVPPAVPGDVVTSPGGPADAVVADAAPLDAAAGAALEWACLARTVTGGQSWFIVGAPVKLSAEALLAVRSLTNQVTLALRTSEVHQELIAQARVDSLTGLANRASFTNDLPQLLVSPGAESAHILFLDLDDFKDVNDILGHQAGDELLIEVARRMRKCTRPGDLCARLGGDEFAVVLRGTDEASAVDIAQRMVDSIAKPIHLSRQAAQVGVSIGIAKGTPSTDIEQLIHEADVAMYAAKASGKGRIQIFENGLLQADSAQLSFERQLAAATRAGELFVEYQPIVDLDDNHCVAIEALVRWQHPERGRLDPADFIDTGERTGAIVDVGAFTLRQACADAAIWRREHTGSSPALHVNVSARQLDDANFFDTVVECLTQFAIPADQLVLELTETVVLNSLAAIVRLKALAAYGIRIAIDEFGSGYSSLTTLRSLPVSVIKLDPTFIAGALTDPVDRTVISAIVHMSSQLGLLTIAEGVERLEQQEFLDGIGADAAQGFMYLRPVPAAQLRTWLRDNLRSEARAVDQSAALKPLRIA